MRPIKFRGQSVDTKEWAYGYYSAKKHDGIECGVIFVQDENNEKNLSAPPVMPETVGQFTGLLDKNGKEIYEGDIIEYESYWYTYGDSGLEKVKKEVTWQNIYGAGWHFGIGQKDGEKQWSFPFPDCEVIGNIYENPDLLSN